MDDGVLHFQGDYYGQTTVHPLGLGMLIVLGLATLCLPRRWALLPAMTLICFVPMSQRIVIAGADFTFLRLMLMFGWARVLLAGEYRHFRWWWLDAAVVAWALANLGLGTRTSGGDGGALVKYLGTTYDALGAYFLGRFLVRGWDDVTTIARGFIVLSVPVALAMLVESRTGRNVFSVFGGVKEITDIREGRLRCQGAFSHPILAGCFWATLLPLMLAQAWRGWRVGAAVGGVCVLAIVFFCASSTPVLALGAGFVGVVGFAAGRQLRQMVIIGAVVVAVALHLVMNQPIWHLFTKITVVAGSSGRHRYRLIDAFVEHSDEWLWAGSTVGTDHWGQGLFDVTNYYIAMGLRGGLPLLLLFGLVLWAGFLAAGRTQWRTRRSVERLIPAAALGVALFQHALNFTAVTYFGQILFSWHLLLAMIGSLERRSYTDQRATMTAAAVDRARAKALEAEPAEDEPDIGILLGRSPDHATGAAPGAEAAAEGREGDVRGALPGMGG